MRKVVLYFCENLKFLMKGNIVEEVKSLHTQKIYFCPLSTLELYVQTQNTQYYFHPMQTEQHLIIYLLTN